MTKRTERAERTQGENAAGPALRFTPIALTKHADEALQIGGELLALIRLQGRVRPDCQRTP